MDNTISNALDLIERGGQGAMNVVLSTIKSNMESDNVEAAIQFTKAAMGMMPESDAMLMFAILCRDYPHSRMQF